MKKNRANQPPYLGECESARGQEDAASYPARPPLFVIPAPFIRHPRTLNTSSLLPIFVILAPLYTSPHTPLFVIPAEAGIHGVRAIFWIPTFVGMTGWGAGMTGWGAGMTDWRLGMTGSKESAAFNGYSGAMNVAPTPCCSNLFCQRACAKSLFHPLNRHFRSFLRFSRGHTTDQIAGPV
jgi:hypothetical protein